MTAAQVPPGSIWTGLALLALGVIAIVRGTQFRLAETPNFVQSYRGWSCTELVLPFGGLHLIALAFSMFRDILSSWSHVPLAIVWLTSGVTFFLGFLVWCPPCLIPAWYWRARKAGVPRHDPHAMARFKRLTKAQQRTTTWPNLPDTP